MAKDKPEQGLKEMPAEAAPEASDFTRAWLVSHPSLGAARVLADSEREAVEEFLRHRGADPAELKQLREQGLRVVEQVFRPADTEKGRPGGWKRKGPKVRHAQ